MRIGFDLDNVFIETPPLIPYALIEALYKDKKSHRLKYRIPTRTEQLLRKATHLHFLRPVIKNNLQELRNLAKTPHELFLISSRFSFLQPETNIIIKKYGLNNYFSALFFNIQNEQPHNFKVKKIKELKLQRYVDDDFDLLKYVSNKLPEVKMYWYHPSGKKQKINNNLYEITSLKEII